MTLLDPHFEDLAGEWLECPVCAGAKACLVCGGEGGAIAEDLPDPEHPYTLKLREGEFA